jgi:hypothetical protein
VLKIHIATLLNFGIIHTPNFSFLKRILYNIHQASDFARKNQFSKTIRLEQADEF